MKSITIHGLDDELAKLIKSKAGSEGPSINKTVKRTLEEAFGVVPCDTTDRRSSFEEFIGLWSRAERDAFSNSTKALGTIDPKDRESRSPTDISSILPNK